MAKKEHIDDLKAIAKDPSLTARVAQLALARGKAKLADLLTELVEKRADFLDAGLTKRELSRLEWRLKEHLPNDTLQGVELPTVGGRWATAATGRLVLLEALKGYAVEMRFTPGQTFVPRVVLVEWLGASKELPPLSFLVEFDRLYWVPLREQDRLPAGAAVVWDSAPQRGRAPK